MRYLYKTCIFKNNKYVFLSQVARTEHTIYIGLIALQSLRVVLFVTVNIFSRV